MKIRLVLFFIPLLFSNGCFLENRDASSNEKSTIRVASYNVSLFRNEEGRLIKDLSSVDNQQARNIAEIIQTVRPDIITLMEFDYDSAGEGLTSFQKNYLSVSQNGKEPVEYEYSMVFPSNTGVASGLDLNNDGKVEGPNDAFGFGRFPGQYAFALLSKYPINKEETRTFQRFLWKDMPGALWPAYADSTDYYTDEEKEQFRLSSKNHADVPIAIPGGTIHLLISHPTPPVFDGPEDKNGRRNHDEIRLWADYISGGDNAQYLYDDKHNFGGIKGEYFMIMGDLNADPVDGDSYNHAIQQLLKHPAVHQEASLGVFVPSSKGSEEKAKAKPRKEGDNAGNPLHDTSVWGLRIDYLLPSKNIEVIESGVFWPSSDDPEYYLIKENAASDHMLVWMDFQL